MAFSFSCQQHVCPDITLIGLTITNSIGKFSEGGLGYDNSYAKSVDQGVIQYIGLTQPKSKASRERFALLFFI